MRARRHRSASSTRSARSLGDDGRVVSGSSAPAATSPTSARASGRSGSTRTSSTTSRSASACGAPTTPRACRERSSSPRTTRRPSGSRGRSLAGLVGKPFRAVVPYEAGGPLESLMRERRPRTALSAPPHVERSKRPGDPTRVAVHQGVSRSGRVASASRSRMSRRRRSSAACRRPSTRVLEMIASGAPLARGARRDRPGDRGPLRPRASARSCCSMPTACTSITAPRRTSPRRSCGRSTAPSSGRVRVRAAPRRSSRSPSSSTTSSPIPSGTTTATSPACTGCAPAGRSRSSRPTTACWGPSRSITACPRSPTPRDLAVTLRARRDSPESRSSASSSRTSSATSRRTSRPPARTSGPASRARSTTSSDSR